MVSDSSIKRRLSQFKGMDIDIIEELDKWETKKGKPGSKQRSDSVFAIKKLLNKPTIADKTALAYARLARQYKQMLVKPGTKIQKIVKQKYKVNLTSSYSTNLQLLGNMKGYIPPPPPPKGLPYLLSRHGKATYQTTMKGWQSDVVNADQKPIRELKNIVYLNQSDVKIAKKNNIKQYRVFVKIQFTVSRGYGYLSSKRLPIASNHEVMRFMDGIQGNIMTQDEYLYGEVWEVIEDIVKVWIEWE